MPRAMIGMPTSQISSDPPVEKQTLSAATDRIVTPRPMTIAIVASHVADWKGDRRKARSRSAGRATVVAGSWKPAVPLIAATLPPGPGREATPGGTGVALATGAPTSVASDGVRRSGRVSPSSRWAAPGPGRPS